MTDFELVRDAVEWHEYGSQDDRRAKAEPALDRIEMALKQVRAVAANTKDTEDLTEAYAMFDHIEGIARRALEKQDG